MTTDKQELQRLCDETLPRVAQEIRDQDIAGWGNACDWAADAIRELLAELAAVTAERDALKARVPDVDEIYKRFCAWCRENEGLDLDPRLHTHSGNAVSVGGYISHRVTSIAFRAFRDGLLSAAKEEGK